MLLTIGYGLILISGAGTHSRQPYQEVQNLRQRLQGFMKYFCGQKIPIPCLLTRFHLKVIEVLMEERKPHKSGPQVKQKISEFEIKYQNVKQ